MVIGSCVRMGQWLPEAVKFVEQQRERLSQIPIAYFAVHLMNMRDDETSRKQRLAYLDPVRRLVAPRKEAFFAGVGDWKKVNFLESLIGKAVKAPNGDFRDWKAVRAWAEELLDDRVPIANQIRSLQALQPAYLHTFPSNLRLLLAHCRETVTRIPSIRSVWTMSETVDPTMRALKAAGFEVLSGNDDLVRGAELVIVTPPVDYRCTQCGHSEISSTRPDCCPLCKETFLIPEGGDGLILQQVEME